MQMENQHWNLWVSTKKLSWKKFNIKGILRKRFSIRGKNLNNGNKMKTGVAILVSDKTNFKTKAIKTDKEGYYRLIKGSTQEKDTVHFMAYIHPIQSTLNLQANTNRHKGKTNNNTITAGH